MSYDLWIVDEEGNHMDAPIVHHQKGGTYVLGGTPSLEINVTFNYSNAFAKAFGDGRGIKLLDGMKAIDSIPLIVSAMKRLGDDETQNYWDPTEGNAKRALESVLHIAALGCDGYWAMGW